MSSTESDSPPADPGNEADPVDQVDDYNQVDGYNQLDDNDDEGDGYDEEERTQSYAVLEYLARQIVDEPDGVSIEQSETRGGIKLSLHVASGDMGKVIGRRGRVAQAIRAVVRATGAREGVDVLVDIVD
jgi:predicted RNA-binding protein YlqC (UPF0109 family)